MIHEIYEEWYTYKEAMKENEHIGEFLRAEIIE